MAERIAGYAADPAVDDAAWRALGDLGIRLAGLQPPGYATAVRDQWLSLDRSRHSAGERIELLIAGAVELGAAEREVRAVVERTRERVGRRPERGDWKPGGARRGRLEVGRPAEPQTQTQEDLTCLDD